MFVNLHVHSSDGSLLDGHARIKDIATRAKELGQDAFAITEHGYMYSTVHAYKVAKEVGIKFIPGVEFYFHPVRRGCNELGSEERSRHHHLTVLAKNERGYRNLLRMASIAATEGMYYQPQIDDEVLEEYREGLIVLSGCPKGYIPSLIMSGKMDEARQKCLYYQSMFPDSFYLEVQYHPVTLSDIDSIRKEQEEFVQMEKTISKGIFELGKDLGIPIVLTNDVHYVDPKDYDAHDLLLAINTRSSIDDENRLRYSSDQFYLKSEEKMQQLFPGREDIINNTEIIASQCDVSIPELDDHKYLMPSFPDTPRGKTEEEYLREIACQELKNRGLDNQEYRDRLDYELGVICEMGFPGYFLMLWELMDWAKKEGISTGCGRGSAASSLVSYVMGITDIDPIKYGLLFHRFLSPSRVSLPDIDSDFENKRRGEIIEHLRDKYGKDHVCQILTIGMLSCKAALKKVMTVYQIPFDVANGLTDIIPDGLTISEALEISSVQEYVDAHPEIQEPVRRAESIEDLGSHAGVHAAGVIVSDKPLWNYVATKDDGKGNIIAQNQMGEVEEIGLLKLDVLGLKNLDIIADTVESIKANHGIELDWKHLPLDDSKTFKVYQRADTDGVFQMESSLFKSYLPKLNPNTFDDVCACVALLRPGCLDASASDGDGNLVDEFVRRKRGESRIQYQHPLMEETLKETYGVCLTGDTKVYDASTGMTVPLKDVKVGMRVQGVDEDYNNVISTVTDCVCNGKKEVIKLTLGNGETLTLTEDHKLLTERGWREAKDILVSNYIALPTELLIDEEKPKPSHPRDFMWALGFATFGSNENGKISITTTNRDAAFFYRDLLARLMINSEVTKRLELKGAVQHKVYYYTIVHDVFDVDFNVGNEIIPEFIFGCCKEDIHAFLGGMWAFNRTLNKNKARFQYNKAIDDDIDILKQMQLLFLRVGIHTKINFWPDRKAWQLMICNGKLFNKELSKYLYNGLKYRTGYKNPSGLDPMFVKGEMLMTCGGLTQFCSKYSVNFNWLNGQIGNHRLQPSDLGTKAMRALPMSSRNMKLCWERVSKREYAGIETVYDITVDKVHNFVANRAIVHNCIYQEQAMEMSRKLAGYTPGESDNLRKIIGKKKMEEMLDQREKFVNGCIANGISEDLATRIFDNIEKMGNYVFNKSHSYSYGYTSYATAYLKSHYPVEFMAALLTSVANDGDKLSEYLASCKQSSINVLPPDINISTDKFVADGSSIRFALSGIKQVGGAAIGEIFRVRDKMGSITSIEDFLLEANGQKVNKTVVESLIRAGAFDNLGYKRSQLINGLESFLKSFKSYKGKVSRAEKKREQLAIEPVSDMAEYEKKMAKIEDKLVNDRLEFEKAAKDSFSIDVEEYSMQEILEMEKEGLGFYVSSHPLKIAQPAMSMVNVTSQQIASMYRGQEVVCGGLIINTNHYNGKYPVTFLTLEDEVGTFTVVVPKNMYSKDMRKNAIVLVSGKIQTSNKYGNNVKAKKIVVITDEMINKVHAQAKAAQENKNAILVMVDKTLVPGVVDLYRRACASHVRRACDGDAYNVLLQRYDGGTRESIGFVSPLAEGNLWAVPHTLNVLCVNDVSVL